MNSVLPNIAKNCRFSQFFVVLFLMSNLSFFNSALAESNQKHNPQAPIVKKEVTSGTNEQKYQQSIKNNEDLKPQKKENKITPNLQNDVKTVVPDENKKSKNPEQHFVQNETSPGSISKEKPSTLKDNLPWVVLLLFVTISTIPIIRFSKVTKMDSFNGPDDKKTSSEPSLIDSSSLDSLVWLVVGHSAIGKDHIKSGTPCQDSRHIEQINKHWGVAVCCDGAGSATNSDIGSKFVAEQTAKTLVYAVKEHEWHTNNQLPNEVSWRELSIQVFYKIYTDLERYAQERRLDIKSLACTVIAVIYSPIGLLVAHIGDGRAAYLNEVGEWKSIMTPFKGEEANQTVFITSTIWQDTDKHIESRVIKDKPYGFTLLSDGCEDFAFLTHINTSKVEGEIKVEDVNQPFDGFYSYAIQRLKKFHDIDDSKQAIQADWIRILETGSEKIRDEPDDKTMILGILV